VSEGLKIWTVILVLGLGTFLIRFSFIGLVGDRELPEWAMRLLRYVPVATGGEPDAARLIASAAALAIGAGTRSVLGAIAGGMAALYLALWAGF
jgi:branched-subunit amino acid transport protein